ncbi:MAG TPA: choice-of-anchor tandem repeat GloVer-containing protein [Rhizomicrobium sp.]|nr:choice-of-anchor tandem repeat GloVer-containing protein [Rhizomicrobium sp.]
MYPGFSLRAVNICLVAGISSLAACIAPADAATFADLHAFCSQTGCPDGNYPTAPLVSDAAGDLFGTTALGGAAGWGTIFEFVPNGKGGYKFKQLHSFCAQANCADGSDPVAGLIIDSAGNLYGTTKFGGAQNGGTVFELLRSGGKKHFRLLHSFCAQGAACTDGSLPVYDGLTYLGAASGLSYDGTSPLYGTTIYGGENNSGYSGTVYELRPGSAKKWKEQVIYQFCARTNCADGMEPHNGLAMDSSGNLYGVTYGGGGGSGDGTVFELSHRKGTWTEIVLYDFCSQANCADGANPESAPVIDASGALVGTTTSGGADDWGVLYKDIPNGDGSQYSVLYSFCSQVNCADGTNPMGRLALDTSGNIFGTALEGGSAGFGTIWQFGGNTFTLLHTFCSGGNCVDGKWPVGGVTLDQSEDIFGTTSEGGSYGDGAVFRLSP